MAKQKILPVVWLAAAGVILCGFMLAVTGCSVSPTGPLPAVSTRASGAAQTPLATLTPAPLPTEILSPTPVPTVVLNAVVKPDGADIYGPSTGGDPWGHVQPGARVWSDARTADGQWFWIGVWQGDCINPTSRPSQIDEFSAIVDPQAYDCTSYGGWVKGEALEFEGDPEMVGLTTDPQAYDYLTPTPTVSPTLTKTPPPFVFITATPNPPGCWQSTYDACMKRYKAEDACRAEAKYDCNPTRFADPQVIPTIRKLYEDFHTFISFRDGPPPEDFAERLKAYMEPGFDVRSLNHQCSYESVVGQISSLLGQGKYIRITAGKPVWKEPYLIDQWSDDAYYQVDQDIIFPSLRLEIVDVKSGRVLKSGYTLSNHPEHVYIVYFLDSQRWRLAASDYCDDLGYAFPRGY